MSNNVATTPAGRRISALLDEKSFVEIGSLVTARSTDFSLGQEKAQGDGVICGYGLIDGNPVYVYSQDSTVLGGSLGEMHAKKICSLYDLAVKTGSPVIGLLDSTGFRLQESTDALEAAGEIYRKMADASGVIPQISVVFGTCGGGMALVPGLSDFTFMEKDAKLFINCPNTIEGISAEKCDIASASYQSEKSGIVDGIGTEEEVLGKVRDLIAILPQNNEDNNAFAECEDDLNRLIPDALALSADAAALLSAVSDNGLLIEKAPDFAKEMVTGLIRLNGVTVGAIANRTELKSADETEKFDARLSGKGAMKAASFVSFCDAFEIPVLTVTNLTGYEVCADTEAYLAGNAATLLSKLASASVPRVSLITKKALGSAYVVMNSRGIGADLVFAWPDAEIGPMEADMAAKILCDGADAAALKEKTAEIKALQNHVSSAAARGYVDTVISPEDTRKYLVGAFEMLFSKKDDQPYRKHSTK